MKVEGVAALAVAAQAVAAQVVAAQVVTVGQVFTKIQTKPVRQTIFKNNEPDFVETIIDNQTVHK